MIKNIVALTLSSVSFSPDGKKIVGGGGNLLSHKPIYIWDSQTYILINKLTGHNGNVSNVNFSQDGEKIVASTDITVRLWDS